jgi:antitoxin component YwqK of YwqJK toxin-antitoxin module
MRNLLLAALCGLFFIACNRIEVDRHFHPNGKLAEEQTFEVNRNGVRLPHGLHVQWRENGTRLSLEVFVHGLRKGYALRWSPSGQLETQEYCVSGVTAQSY